MLPNASSCTPRIVMLQYLESEFAVHKFGYLKKLQAFSFSSWFFKLSLFCARSSRLLICFCRDCLQVSVVCGAAFSSRVVPAEVSGCRAMLNTRKKLVKENVTAGGNWDEGTFKGLD